MRIPKALETDALRILEELDARIVSADPKLTEIADLIGQAKHPLIDAFDMELVMGQFARRQVRFDQPPQRGMADETRIRPHYWYWPRSTHEALPKPPPPWPWGLARSSAKAR